MSAVKLVPGMTPPSDVPESELPPLTEAQREWVQDLYDTPFGPFGNHPLAYCAPEIIEQRAAQLARQNFP